MAIIIVACKLPSGLNMGALKEGRPDVVLNGANHPSAATAHGFGLTPVDADAFDKWIKDHADLPAVKKGLIFAQARKNDATAQAREHKAIKSGFEGVDPEKPAPGIEETDESKRNRRKAQARREEAADEAASMLADEE